jgi:hypothetical protein
MLFFQEEGKGIKISYSADCYETYPSHVHEVKIFKEGQKEINILMTGSEICKLFQENTMEIPSHFKNKTPLAVAPSVTITYSSYCLESEPCKHDVVITKNGQKTESRMFSTDICTLYKENGLTVPSHFQKYDANPAPLNTNEISYSAYCYDTIPCQHDIIFYQGDKKIVTCMTAPEICELYKERNLPIPFHFQ